MPIEKPTENISIPTPVPGTGQILADLFVAFFVGVKDKIKALVQRKREQDRDAVKAIVDEAMIADKNVTWTDKAPEPTLPPIVASPAPPVVVPGPVPAPAVVVPGSVPAPAVVVPGPAPAPAVVVASPAPPVVVPSPVIAPPMPGPAPVPVLVLPPTPPVVVATPPVGA